MTTKNFITKLQEDHNAALVAFDVLMSNLTDIRGYLESEKFRCGNELDGYVNVKDVLDRLRFLENDVQEVYDNMNIQSAFKLTKEPGQQP